MENGTHFAQAGRQAGRQADVCGLFRGDCFRHLKTLADGAIDALITDPPFGVTDNAWDKALDLQRFWAAIEPKLSPRGIVVFFACGRFVFDLYASRPAWYRYDLVWRKDTAIGSLNANLQPLRAHEWILIFAPRLKATTYHPQKTGTPLARPIERWKSGKRGGGCYDGSAAYVQRIDGLRHPTSVLDFAGVPRSDRVHATQKPLDLMRWLVRSYSRPGDLVCDPFAGSGTTAIAVAMEGRRYFACEKDPRIFALAQRRLAEAIAQPLAA
jgi:site-specific DNA-methyltransferase (adenine-specific)